MADWIWWVAPLALVACVMAWRAARRRAPPPDAPSRFADSPPASQSLPATASTIADSRVDDSRAAESAAAEAAEAALREAQDSARRELAARERAEREAAERAAAAAAAEREAAERAAAERLAAEAAARAEAERVAAEAQRRAAEIERAERERREAEARAAQEQAAREQAAREQAAREQAAREQAAREQAEAARRVAEAAEAERRVAEAAEAERRAAEAARVETERAAQLERERSAQIEREQRQREAEATVAPAPRRPAQTLVMVADDSKVVRVKTSRLLAAHQFRVVLAEDGQQALELMQREAPQVLITDVEMPGLDGLQLTRRLRADLRTSSLPVVMITSSDDRLKDEAAAAGVTVLMGKPFSDEDLIGHVARLAGVMIAA